MDDTYINGLMSNAISIVTDHFIDVAERQTAPSVIYKPKLTLDGNMYCALLGDCLHDGVAGFGETAEKAFLDFDDNFRNSKAPTAFKRKPNV